MKSRTYKQILVSYRCNQQLQKYLNVHINIYYEVLLAYFSKIIYNIYIYVNDHD